MNASTQLEISELYKLHKNWLNHFLQKRLNCSHKAADLVQDTYLRILINGTPPPKEYARQYLAKIAKGLLIDQYRRWRVEQAYLASLQELPEQFVSSPESQQEVIETLLYLDRLLYNLSSKARQAFLLRRIDGLSYREISTQLNVSVSSVEKYIAKALQTCALVKLQEL
ncbi:MAG: sigma-70 family RNA polymerase sigma factor [Acidiferrobacterales bacterium]|nr:sigma-70 family RNA polymerase sigma factor [Acidiferrobacterales bacterium]